MFYYSSFILFLYVFAGSLRYYNFVLILYNGFAEICSKREAFEGMDYRIAPAVKSPFQKCVERAAFRGDADVFVPSVGTIFDSKDEAYDFYNMFSWECGFGIRYGKSSTNNKNYRTMQDIVCQCAVCIILILIVCFCLGRIIGSYFFCLPFTLCLYHYYRAKKKGPTQQHAALVVKLV